MKFFNFLKCHEDQTHNSVSIYGPQAVILCDSVQCLFNTHKIKKQPWWQGWIVQVN